MLINPNSKYVESSWACRRFFAPIAPLGLIYIASILEKNKIDVIVIDQFAEALSNKDILEKVKIIKPEVIGFSCLTPVMNNINELVPEIKKINVGTKIILGNIHASLFADNLLKDKIADIVIHGDGEFSMLEVISALEKKRSLKNIQGISFLEDGAMQHNYFRQPIENLDSLPFPSWHLLNLKYYKQVPLAAVYGGIALPIIASRGCKFRCLYCAQDAVHKKPIYRKIINIVNEIEYVHERYNVKYFGFSDAYFPFSIIEGLNFCRELIKRRLNKRIRWCTQMRADIVNLELLMNMKEAGAHLIMYGFESGNQNILDKMNKRITLEQSRMAMKYTKKAKILGLGFFMLGLPGENRRTCEETIRFAKELDCDIAKFNIAIPYPGSKFFNDYYKDKVINIDEVGKFTPWLDWTSYSGELAYTPKDMSSDEIIGLQRKGMLQFYLRPKIIIRHIIKRKIRLGDLFFGGYLLIIKYLQTLFKRNFCKFKSLK